MKSTAKTTTFSIILILSVLFMPVCAFAWPVPESGVTQCYNDTEEITCPAPVEDFYGQNADYTINPRSYTKLNAGGNDLSDDATEWVMVRDNVTGLIWEVKQAKDDVADYDNPHDADNRYTWYDSNPETNGGGPGTPGDGTDTEDFINALNTESFGGYSDWRLPTIKELASIANMRTLDPATDTEYFPNTQSWDYWSATTRALGTNRAWCVNFHSGDDGYNNKSGSRYVRGVRSGQSESSDNLVINGDDTVTDTKTGLMWQQQGTGSTMNWKESLAYCENLSLAEYEDWRLPTREELRSIADYGKYNPAIDTEYFPDTQSSYYWSSTTNADSEDSAWDVFFYYGYDNYGSKSGSRYVRAVRGGQTGPFNALVISLTPASGGTVTGTGISCPGDCVQIYGFGIAVQLTATPADCYEFTNWSGDCSGTNPTCDLTMNADKSATANFAIKTFTVTIIKAGNGTGTLSESTQTVNCGDSLTVTATPDASSTFAGWSGDASGTGNAVLTNITSNKTITATFNLKTFKVTINKAGNGTGNLSASTQTVNYGSNLTITANPDASSTFAGWSGNASGTGNAVLTNITSDKTITATFNLKTFKVTINKAGNGTGTLSESTQTVNCGDSLTVTATPDISSIFTGWSGDATGTGNAVLPNITSDKTITATFNLKTFTVATNKTGNGTVTGTGISCPGDCTETYNSGTSVQLAATPADCHEFTNWSGDCSGTNPTCDLTMNANKSATANFAIKTFEVTINKAGNGTLSESTQTVNCGDTLTITATPDISSEFAGWSGDASGSENPLELPNITSDMTVTATFTTKKPSAITCKLSTDIIILGDPIRITGRLTPSPDEAENVGIELTHQRTRETVNGTALADMNGEFSYDLPCDDLTSAGIWIIQTRWKGNETLEGSASPEQILIVNKAETGITLHLPSDAIKTDEPVSISGKFTPWPECGRDHSDIPVTLRISGPDNPSDTQSVLTDNQGDFSLDQHTGFAAPGDWTIRALFDEDDAFLSSESDVITVRVTEKQSLMLLLSPDDDTGRSDSDNLTKKTSGITIIGSGKNGFTAKLYDNGEEIPGASAVVSQDAFSTDISLSQGVHKLTVTQTDTAGKESEPSSPLEITVDTDVSPPWQLSLSSPRDSDISDADNLTRHTSDLEIGGFGEDGAIVQLYGNGNPISTTTVSGYVFSVNIFLTEGTYIITAVQTDPAGNTSPLSATLTITMDVSPPAPPEFREAVTPTSNTRPSWHWKSGGGNGKFRYRLDNSDLNTAASETRNTIYTPETDLSEGMHTLYLQECDDAGNWSASASSAIEVVSDSIPGAPRVSGITPTRETIPTWTWTSGGSGIGKYRYKLNSDTLDTDAELTDATSYTSDFALSPEGPHTLYVQEQDAAGNWSASGSFTIETDSGTPFSQASAPVSADVVNRTFTITYTCYDVYADNEESSGSGLTSVKLFVRGPNDRAYTLADTDSGNAIDGTFEYTAADPGEYFFYTIASDRAGNTEELPYGEYDAKTVYSSEFSGYAILSVGSVRGQEGIEAHTLSANNIYSYLIQQGFALIGDPLEKWNDPLDNIKYFNPYVEPQTGEDDYTEDGSSYKQAMQEAVTGWAADKMNTLPGPLYIILLDHGSPDTFYLTGEQPVSAYEMDEWLDTLEEKTEGIGIRNPETGENEPPPIVVILGISYSGSFIDDLSAPGRIIVASSAADEPSYRGPYNPYSGVRDGDFFTSSLFKELNEGYSLRTAFGRAVIRTEAYTDSGGTDRPLPWDDTATQHPLLDDNGDGVGTNSLTASGGDGLSSEDIFLGHGYDAPEPLRVTDAGTDPLTPPALDAPVSQATLWAEVSDTERTDNVWVEIRNPGMILEQQGENQQTVELDSLPLAWNDSEERYEGVYDGFTDSGKYILFFYAKDKTGIISPFKKAYLYKDIPPFSLADAVLILRILCGMDTSAESISLAGDFSGDGKVGIEDAVGILRQLAEL